MAKDLPADDIRQVILLFSDHPNRCRMLANLLPPRHAPSPHPSFDLKTNAIRELDNLSVAYSSREDTAVYLLSNHPVVIERSASPR
jgi:hypothetical protein